MNDPRAARNEPPRDFRVEVFACKPHEQTAAVLQQSDLDPFVGGQVRIENEQEGYCFCAEVQSLTLEGAGRDVQLHMEPAWVAKLERDGWRAGPSRTYLAGLATYDLLEKSPEALCIQSFLTSERAEFHRPGVTLLRREEVRPAR